MVWGSQFLQLKKGAAGMGVELDQYIWTQIQLYPYLLGDLGLYPSETQFPHLYNGANNDPYLGDSQENAGAYLAVLLEAGGGCP